MSFSSQKQRFSRLICPVNDGVEHTIISRHISSKSMEVSEVTSTLPQMENVIHNIREIANWRFIKFGQQTVSMYCWWIVFSFNVLSISSNVGWWSFKTNLRYFSWILFIFLYKSLDVNIQIRRQYENWDFMMVSAKFSFERVIWISVF